MRKVILTFGLLSGVVISVLMLLGMMLLEKGVLNFDNTELVGYGSMVIALSMVFFGIKSYRDNYQNGAIKFTKGLQIGLLITLVASVMYAATWETYYQSRPEVRATFLDKYAEHYTNKMRAKGVAAAEIDEQIKSMEQMKELYKNPAIRFGMTVMEILPVGLIITLLSAAILRRKELLPALEPAGR